MLGFACGLIFGFWYLVFERSVTPNIWPNYTAIVLLILSCLLGSILKLPESKKTKRQKTDALGYILPALLIGFVFFRTTNLVQDPILWCLRWIPIGAGFFYFIKNKQTEAPKDLQSIFISLTLGVAVSFMASPWFDLNWILALAVACVGLQLIHFSQIWNNKTPKSPHSVHSTSQSLIKQTWLISQIYFAWEVLFTVSIGKQLLSILFLFGLVLGSWTARQILNTRQIKIKDEWLITLSILVPLMLPSFLGPNLYPLGSGLAQVLGSVTLALLLLSPLSIAMNQGPIEIHARSLRGILLSFLIFGVLYLSFGSWIGYVILTSVFALSFFWPKSDQSLEDSKVQKKLMLGILVVGLSSWILILQKDRLLVPSDERVIQDVIHFQDHYVLSRDQSSGDLRIRKNLHYQLASVQLYKQMRRHTLLPIRLHAKPQRILIIGSSNWVGISAALEQKPQELYILDPVDSINPFSKFFTSELAAKNQVTRVFKISVNPMRFLAETQLFFDVIVVEPLAPWEAGADSLYSSAFSELLKLRVRPDGVLAYWVSIFQWDQHLMSRQVQRWIKVFGDTLSVWRADLSPDYPMMSFVSRKQRLSEFASSKDASSRADSNDALGSIQREPSYDSLLSSLPGQLSLFLGDFSTIQTQFGQAVSQLESGSIEIQSAWNRFFHDRIQKEDSILRFLTSMGPEDGPSYGGLIWSRAILKARAGEKDWETEKKKAIEYLGFDPSPEFQNVFPKAAGR